MPQLLGIIIVISIIGYIIDAAVKFITYHWVEITVFFGFVVFIIILAVIVMKNEARNLAKLVEAEQRQAEEERRRLLKIEEDKKERMRLIKERKDYKDEQISLANLLASINNKSLTIFISTPNLLIDVETRLDKAKAFFDKKAFHPFWDSIHGAIIKLGEFNNSVQELKDFSNQYKRLSEVYDGSPASFSLTEDAVEGLAAANSVAKRLSDIVQNAHCDFQFAQIYGQWKTNSILVSGFSNLAEALEGIGDRIAASIDSLGATVDAISNSIEGFRTQIQDAAEHRQSQLAAIQASLEEGYSQLSDHLIELRTNMDTASERTERAIGGASKRVGDHLSKLAESNEANLKEHDKKFEQALDMLSDIRQRRIR